MKVKKTLAGVLSGALLIFSLPIAVGAMIMTDTSMDVGAQVFSDVSVSNPNYTAITYLKVHGVINGYPDGTFKPDQVVNRAEALKIILLGSGEQVAATVDLEPFRDVPRADWYATFVAKAKELGIVEGYADGTFKPAQTVNLVENLKILLLTQKVDLNTIVVISNPYADAFADQWYAKYVEYAKEKNLIDADGSNMIFPAQGMTRGKLAEAMYRLMLMKEMGWDKYMPGETQQTQQTTQQTQQQTQQTTQQLTANVDIQDFTFVQSDLTVKAGTTVVWTNKDSSTHTVTSDTGTALNSGNLSLNQTFSMVFTTPGTYTYHCGLHPFMTGKVTVTP